MQNVNKSAFGMGIFTVPDIAKILNLPLTRVRYCVNNIWDTKYNEKHTWGTGRDKSLNFYTMIELYVFDKLKENGIKTSKIIEAHNQLSKTLYTQYPFATSNILAGNKDIFFVPDSNSVITADKTMQYNLKDILLPFCKKIRFNDKNMADCFFPMGKEHDVVVDPLHKFGQPTILGTNILTYVIYNMYIAGDTPEFLSELYELPIKKIEDAILYNKNWAA